MERRSASGLAVPSLRGREDECTLLDELLHDVRRGRSRSLAIRGEAGIGKTALLGQLVDLAPDFALARGLGVESDMELAYASLHQLCAPLLNRTSALPDPQRRALEVVFGLIAGDAPDRFLVGLAVLSLLSEVAEDRPLLCVVDDAQWLDQMSALTLAFVARRLHAERLGLVFAVREPSAAFGDLPALRLDGLRDGEARALLTSAVPYKLDGQVIDRIVAETRGNPLALLELPRGLSAAELTGFGTVPFSASSGRIEESFRRRIVALPDATRQLLLIASAEPLGEPTLLWRAAALQGVRPEASIPAAEAGLCEFGVRIRFRHPLARAAAYRAGSPDERWWAHAALAEVTDAATDPDRRAWHLALASAGTDDAVADELERSAARARARGGQPAAAALLERAAHLTLDPARRAERALVAAESKYLAGSAEDALRLAAVAECGPLDEAHRVRVDILRGRVAVMQRRAADAPPLLLDAARRLERLDRRVARETYRDALIAAVYAGRFAGDSGLPVVAAAVRATTSRGDAPSVADELLDATAMLIDAGFAAGAERARRAVLASLATPELDLPWRFFALRLLGQSLWDPETWDSLSAQLRGLVRDAGVLALVPMTNAQRVGWELYAGDLTAAHALIVEQETVHRAIGGERSTVARLALEAFRGRETEVVELDRAITAQAVARGDGPWVAVLHWSRALLANGLGRYAEALGAAQLVFEHPFDLPAANWALSELVEAAARCDRPDAARAAIDRLGEMASACGTQWVLGVEARARALVEGGVTADALFRRAIEHLERTPFRTEVARAHLLYGEWLRREKRRAEARDHLRAAHASFASIGMEAFAARAGRELTATGETVRKRTVDTRDDLTPQERQIAELARDGFTNPEIGGQLFLSARTVEWHLRKVFSKLGVRSRRELAHALPGLPG